MLGRAEDCEGTAGWSPTPLIGFLNKMALRNLHMNMCTCICQTVLLHPLVFAWSLFLEGRFGTTVGSFLSCSHSSLELQVGWWYRASWLYCAGACLLDHSLHNSAASTATTVKTLKHVAINAPNALEVPPTQFFTILKHRIWSCWSCKELPLRRC